MCGVSTDSDGSTKQVSTPQNVFHQAQSPLPVTPRSSRSPFSPTPSPLLPTVESDDAMSIASTVSGVDKCIFQLSQYWPPSIMACIDQPTEEGQRLALGPLVHNEIVRTLATQMFCYTPKPQKGFCTEVAKMLVKKYPFMTDVGERVSGYVSIHNYVYA